MPRPAAAGHGQHVLAHCTVTAVLCNRRTLCAGKRRPWAARGSTCSHANTMCLPPSCHTSARAAASSSSSSRTRDPTAPPTSMLFSRAQINSVVHLWIMIIYPQLMVLENHSSRRATRWSTSLLLRSTRSAPQQQLWHLTKPVRLTLNQLMWIFDSFP